MNEPTIDLLPCPFCDKPDTARVSSSFDIYDDDQGNGECWAVFCDASNPNGRGGCGASGGFKPTQHEAIEAWNKRASLKSLDAQPVPVEPKLVRIWRKAYGPDNEFLVYIDTLQSALKLAQEERDKRMTRMMAAEKRAEKAEAINRRMVDLLKEPSANMKSAGYGKPDYLAIFKAMSAELIKEVEK